MATPLTDFRSRLRSAGLTELQAEAISAGFEVLDRKIDGLERRLDRIEWWQRAQALLLGLILAATVAAPAAAPQRPGARVVSWFASERRGFPG